MWNKDDSRSSKGIRIVNKYLPHNMDSHFEMTQVAKHYTPTEILS